MKNPSTYDPEKEWIRTSQANLTETTFGQAVGYVAVFGILYAVLYKLGMPEWAILAILASLEAAKTRNRKR